MKTTKNREESKTEEIIKKEIIFAVRINSFVKKSIKKVEKHVLLFFF